ncbi:Ankyrin repeat and LEM [Dermatophagoides pteronyssinus]|uniref:Ankyrin repeat and LEM n=1 Tax=Dermatophagoides pteronyssinus TaxID=6956 RepID=A0ABQ8JML7_DERPT|nr:Ankyrin repeat and LEM [Dermatophagoides pteronyssinus]
MDIGTDMIFYAACIPQQARITIPSPGFNPEHFMSNDKNEILKLIKRYKGSRFKSFAQYDEALKFVLEENCDVITNTPSNHILSSPNNSPSSSQMISSGSKSAGMEEAPPFPSIELRDLNVFKRAITNKQLDSVQQFVYNNPRYLISNYFDSPTIIVQGARYNAVHLAIRNKSPEILNFILDTINSVDFVQKMNPNFAEESLIEKRDHLLDMYLNSPDKVNFDTPLHMACKFGDLECITILVGYIPVLDTQKLNKQNLLPYQVVQESSLRKKVQELINSSVFITVTKSVDNFDKSINKACQVGKKMLESTLKNTPEKNVQISAIVGPMTTEKSKKIYEIFKSPKRCTPEQRKIRLQDPERGLERVVCELSKEFDLEYCEYWPFLGEFVDFSQEKYLKKLDDYLRSVHDELYLIESLSKMEIKSMNENGQLLEDNEFHDLNDENSLNDNNDDDDDDDNDIYYTPPTKKIDDNVYNAVKLALKKRQSFHDDNDDDNDNDDEQQSSSSPLFDENLQSKYPFLIYWFRNDNSDNGNDGNEGNGDNNMILDVVAININYI